MSGGKYNSFGITLRTRVGINPGLKSGFDKWIKSLDYGAYVFEKEGTDEHIHAQIWIDEARTRGNVKRPCDKLIRKYFDPEDYKLSIASCVRIAYSDEFVDQYMEKENELVYSKIPPDVDREKYYPSEDEQELAQQKVHSKNLWVRELEVLWNQHATEEEKATINDFTVAEFLSRMFVMDLWSTKKDLKIRLQEREMLKIWLTKNGAQNLYLSKDMIQLKNQMSHFQ